MPKIHFDSFLSSIAEKVNLNKSELDLQFQPIEIALLVWKKFFSAVISDFQHDIGKNGKVPYIHGFKSDS